MEDKIKRCCGCFRFLGETAFGFRGDYTNIRKSLCKKCETTRRSIRYYTETREHDLERGKQWIIDNREQRNTVNRKYYAEHPELFKQKRIKRKEHHKKYIQEQHYPKNKDRYFNSSNSRRANIELQSLQLTDLEKQKINMMYYICSYLNKGLDKPAWHVDHKMPLDKGGLHHPDNLWIMPATDNLSKGTNEGYELNHNFYFELW